MNLLRSLLFQILFIGSTLYYSSAIIIAGRLGASTERVGRLGCAWGLFNLAALRRICGLTYRIQGSENLPSAGETVIALCKHQSTWETVALRGLFPPTQSWVLKQELMRLPFFGWALAQQQPIAIDRSDARRSVIKLIRDGEKLLAAGRWVIIFPEGTRVAPGVRQPYNIGGALLAEKTGYPVLPIAHNAGYFWGRRSFVKHPGTIDLVIGPMIQTKGRKSTEINAEVEAWIESTVAGLPKREGFVQEAAASD